MKFFIFQPEVLSTINVIMGSRIGSIPSTLLFGALFIIIVIVGLVVLRKKCSFSSIIMYAALLCWLPLLVQFSYNVIKEFNDTWFALFQPESEQIVWRYCRIDKYQDLNGVFCGLYPFVEQVRNNIPAGSSFAFLDSNSAPYLVYYLYDTYAFAPLDEVQYLIVYRPLRPYVYDKGVLYKDVDRKIKVGTFDVVAYFGPDRIILKRHDK